jgi:cob(I)alamin adenosyltransferase
MANIYTKGGDKGETSLVGGQRITKSDSRINLYGSVDELNSFIGLLVSSARHYEVNYNQGLLESIQNSLFDLGSNLASLNEDREKFKLPQISLELVNNIEKEIDKMQVELPELKNFILPGGSMTSSYAHVCRTVCRRVERQLVDFSIKQPSELPQYSKEFLNRLSDYFFVFSRYINKQLGEKEILWSKNG